MNGAAPEMKVKALAPWFGGKRTLAPRIVAELGQHSQYFEPFCGAMSVLLAKEPSQKETVCDLHGDLCNLALVVQDPVRGPELYDRLQRTLFCEGVLLEAQHQLGDGGSLDSLERAYWYFVACWMGRKGTAGMDRTDYQIAVRWTKGGGSSTVAFCSAVDSVPAWHRRLANVVILQRNAFDIIERFEDVTETAIYVDPPYPLETRTGGSDCRYLHDFRDCSGLFGNREKDEHARLAAALRGYRKARIVVSSYDCARVRELYSGWTLVECPINKQLYSQNGRGTRKRHAPEILLINGPSCTGGWR